MKITHALLVRLFFFFLLFNVPPLLFAQQSAPPGLRLIREDDLKKDLYALADAHFRGRSAGTPDELKAAAWLAGQYRAIGLQPAGDDGTYFQYFTLWRNVLADQSTIRLNGADLKLWKDVAVSQMANISLDAPIVYLGDVTAIDTAAIDVRGKLVAMEANPNGINMNVSLPTWRYHRNIYAQYGAPLIRKGAAGVIFISDAMGETVWNDAVENYKRGTYDIDGGPNENLVTRVPVLWLHAGVKNELQHGPVTLKANLVVAKYPYPSVNVIGAVSGSHAVLKSEYVLYSGHTDAHGVRNPVNGDSVYHGADDNASVDVAMLADARAFVKYPAKRSVLFIIHGAEERGLLGSRYFVQHPTVPVNAMVAVLNGDMIGRNNTDSAVILGVKPPHRNSAELVNMALQANSEGPRFILTDDWDAPTHPEGWYFRSDHVPYARLGIPALMYTSLLHPDYHTPLDNAENINYPKLKKMADWMYRTGWKVANASKRPATDKDFKLER